MPSSFTVIISQLLLNQLSDEIYPSIKDKLTQTSSIPALDVSVTWTIVKPPDFELGRDQSTSFILNVAIDLTVTPTGGSPTTTPLQTLATCDISISTDGKLGIAVSNLHFFTDDPFLKEILEAEKIAIISMLQEVLQTIEIPIGPVLDIEFTEYETEIQNGALIVGGSPSGGGGGGPAPRINRGFAISFSEPLMRTIVDDVWWESASKTIKSEGATIKLNKYQIYFKRNGFALQLGLTGSLEHSWGILGDAEWEIRFIGPVEADFQLMVDDDKIEVGHNTMVARLNAKMIPLDDLAMTEMLFAKLFLEDDLDDIVSSKIAKALLEKINGLYLFSVPPIDVSFSGINFSVTPANMQTQTDSDAFVLYGDATVTVD